MGGSHPKQLTRFGLFYLEEAFLDVLFEATSEGACLQPAKICEKLGIPKRQGKGYTDYPIAYGVLDKLKTEGRVEQESPDGKAPWKLTSEELKSRCYD